MMGGEVYYYHNDHLEGTHIVTNQSGSAVERTRYYPYGKILREGYSRDLYTGHEWGTLVKLYYAGSRYYDPEARRYNQPDSISPDPTIPDLYNPQALNRYSYTYNNPLKYTDPDGNYAVSFDFTFTVGMGLGASISFGGVGAVSDSFKITQGKFVSISRGVSSPTGSAAIRIIPYSNVQEVGELSGKSNELSADVTVTPLVPISGPVSAGAVLVWENEADSELSLFDAFKECIKTEPAGKGITFAADVNIPVPFSAGFTEVDTVVVEEPNTDTPYYRIHGLDFDVIKKSINNMLVNKEEDETE